MIKETFDKIKETLETRIIKCEQFLYGIETTDDLKKLTIEQAQHLQRFCRDEEVLQTKFVQCDFYHLKLVILSLYCSWAAFLETPEENVLPSDPIYP